MKQVSTVNPPSFAEEAHFKTEVCSCSGCSLEAMRWIGEVEVSTSVDDLKTSQSI